MKFLRFYCLLLVLTFSSSIAWAQVTITRPVLDGPVRLVCLTPNALVQHVSRLTRNQIIGVRYAARDGDIRSPCDDVQLPVGTTPVHERWIQTRDGWWVLAQTVQYPTGVLMVTVDPMEASYGRQPVQFVRLYGDYFIPIIPRNNRQVLPSEMTPAQRNEWVRREMERMRN